MKLLLDLFAPLIAQLLGIAAHFGEARLPEIKGDAEEIVSTLFAIAAQYVTIQLTGAEAKDVFILLVDELKAKGLTLLGKLEVEEEKLPSEIMDGLTASFTSIPGALLKLI